MYACDGIQSRLCVLWLYDYAYVYTISLMSTRVMMARVVWLAIAIVNVFMSVLAVVLCFTMRYCYSVCSIANAIARAIERGCFALHRRLWQARVALRRDSPRFATSLFSAPERASAGRRRQRPRRRPLPSLFAAYSPLHVRRGASLLCPSRTTWSAGVRAAV